MIINSSMNSFLKLDDFLVPPPLPAIIAVLIVLGIKYLGDRLLRKLYQESYPPIQAAAAFISTAAMLAAFVHLLAFAGWHIPGC